MKHRSIWFYISIAGIVFSLGFIVYGVVTDETIMIGKLLLVLGLSIFTLVRHRKPKSA